MDRILLAALIALAVALAPVGSALAASNAVSKSAMHDCHGKGTKDLSCCDTMAKCPASCGIKCCKLMGMIVGLVAIDLAVFVPPAAVDQLKPPDWQLRPRPPPPRS